MNLPEAVESVLLGESLDSLHVRFQMAMLGVAKEEDLPEALGGLRTARRQELCRDATRFLGSVCRHLGERHAGDERIGRVIEDWARKSKDYDAFDALLCHFRFHGRERWVEEGRRLFPRTLTEHWS